MNDMFGEMFRSLFGIPRQEHFPNQRMPEHGEPHDPDGFPGGGQFFFFHSPFFGGMNPGLHEEGDHDDEDVVGFPGKRNSRDPFGFGMDMFEQMFAGLGIPDLPGHGAGFGIGPPMNNDPGDLRDHMLKEPETSQPPVQIHRQHPFFGDIFMIPDINKPDMYRGPGPQNITDSDLDEEVRKSNFDPNIGPSNGNPPRPGMIVPSEQAQSGDGDIQPRPGGKPYQAFKSVSMHTYRNHNGHIEERKTIQDGRGNKETTITRSVGGQRHTVTKHKDHDGHEETSEKFENMDETEKDNFNSKWNSRPSPGGAVYGNRTMPYNNGVDKETASIFQNLFGKGFPGFGGDKS